VTELWSHEEGLLYALAVRVQPLCFLGALLVLLRRKARPSDCRSKLGSQRQAQERGQRRSSRSTCLASCADIAGVGARVRRGL